MRAQRKKPTRDKLTKALELADQFVAGNTDGDTSNGRIADEILGPILADYREIRRLLKRALSALRESVDWDCPLIGDIETGLTRSER